jgi:peroxiredoxin
VEKVQIETSQEYGFNSKGKGLIELVAVTDKDGGWLKQLTEEADCCLAADKVYAKLLHQAGQEVKDVAARLAHAEIRLKEVRTKLTLPVLREHIDHQLKDHADKARRLVEEAGRRAEVVGKPAPRWKTTDLDGNFHALEDYRGKVVILDFWYRGCGWCIKAMPQVAQLAADFKDEPVAVLGMSTDDNETDARVVAGQMKLTYPVLKAAGLPEKYQVQGFPTLVIIDQAGNVRDRHVGYSPMLRDDASKTVRKLLGKE